VGDLESLEAVASFGLLSDDVQNAVDQFSSFGVVTFGPIVSGSGLSENEVVGSEKLTERSSSNGVHGSGFQVHKDGSGDVSSSGSLIVINVDSFELEVGVSVVGSGGVNSVFVRDDFPEFGSDLVSALSSLDVYDFSHVSFF
jgi:proteasome assembly chaperone (PAC2) family protein